MQSSGQPITQSTVSPAVPLQRHLRWQVILVLIGVLLLATLLGYSTYNITTVLIPAQGGVFREGVAGNPQTFSPFFCTISEVDRDLCGLLYRGLTKLDNDGRVVPDLAEDWTITESRIYTFRLKDDQFWHDGQPVTAEDVLFTIGVLQHESVANLPVLSQLWRTVQVEQLDDYTVRFSLQEPFIPFLSYTTIGLLPQHIWSHKTPVELTTLPLDGIPIGNGPLQVTAVDARLIQFSPSPFYVGKPAYLSALELHFYPDHPSLFTAFEQDEIDGISQVLPSDLPIANARDDLNLFSTVESEHLLALFNFDSADAPFLRDPLVRKALYHAIDRERIVAETTQGYGVIAHTLLPPTNWAYSDDVIQYEYDPQKAMQLLTQSGWIDSDSDGVRDNGGQIMQLLFHVNNDSIHYAIAQQIAEDWRAIGVHTVAQPSNFAALVNDILVPRNFSVALVSWELSGDPDPYPLWHSTQAANASGGTGQNFSNWRNERADEILQRVRVTENEEIRQELYRQFHYIFSEELPALPILYPIYTYGISTEVQNAQIGVLHDPRGRFDTFVDWYMVTKRVPANQVPTLVPPKPPGE
ncbi:MAG: peptide ABC transporter substrate-binding protein [Chloroflexota bacterium]